MTDLPKVSFSIVSHGHRGYLIDLLSDLTSLKNLDFEVILTANVPEDTAYLADFKGLNIKLVQNVRPRGFGDNHNAAFAISSGELFVVLNPDIRIQDKDISRFFSRTDWNNIGALAPMIVNANNEPDNNSRKFPTFLGLCVRFLMRPKKQDYLTEANHEYFVDWVAGMFVIFPADSFAAVRGFDPKFFMYMEDADICRRLTKNGQKIVLTTHMSAIHLAQRDSRRKLRPLYWHVKSAFKYFWKLN